MLPSTSAQIQQGSRKGSHSRHGSAATIPPQSPKPATKQLAQVQPPAPKPHYTVIIRLPFQRSDFVDPPLVDWDTTKDRALWKLISKASNSKDLNWDEIAAKFDVSLPFLLQQAAWLYERHFASMKAQMQKLGGVGGSPAPGTPVVESTGSGDGVRPSSKDSKVPPSISTSRRDSPLPTADSGSVPGTPRVAAPLLSRTPSTNTVTQSKVFATSQRQPLQRAFRGSSGSNRRPPPPTQPIGDATSEDEDNSERSFEEEAVAGLSKSRAFRRPLYGKKPSTARTLSSEADDEDEDDSSGGGFLPFAAASKQASVRESDPAATLKESPAKQTAASGSTKRHSTTPTKPKTKEPRAVDSSESSASSAQPQGYGQGQDEGRSSRPGPLSPRHRAELEKLSPRHKKSGSEGTPSMGSSFSDLDDASVTQSALEEALMSNLGGASIASRMSSIGNAWKPKK